MSNRKRSRTFLAINVYNKERGTYLISGVAIGNVVELVLKNSRLCRSIRLPPRSEIPVTVPIFKTIYFHASKKNPKPVAYSEVGGEVVNIFFHSNDKPCILHKRVWRKSRLTRGPNNKKTDISTVWV